MRLKTLIIMLLDIERTFEKRRKKYRGTFFFFHHSPCVQCSQFKTGYLTVIMVQIVQSIPVFSDQSRDSRKLVSFWDFYDVKLQPFVNKRQHLSDERFTSIKLFASTYELFIVDKISGEIRKSHILYLKILYTKKVPSRYCEKILVRF